MLLQLLSDVSGIRVVARKDSRIPRVELDWIRFCTFSVSVAGTCWLVTKLYELQIKHHHDRNAKVPRAVADAPTAVVTRQGGAVAPTATPPALPIGQEQSLATPGTFDSRSNGDSVETTPQPLVRTYSVGVDHLMVPLSQFLDLVKNRAVTAVAYQTGFDAAGAPGGQPRQQQLTFEVSSDASRAVLSDFSRCPPVTTNEMGATKTATSATFSTTLVPGSETAVFTAIQQAGIPHAVVPAGIAAQSRMLGSYKNDHMGTGTSADSAAATLAPQHHAGGSYSSSHGGGMAAATRHGKNRDIVAALTVDLITLAVTLAFCYWYYDYNPFNSSGSSSDNVWNKVMSADAKDGGASTMVRFQDVAGFRKQKQELQEVIAYIKNPASFHMLGAVPPLGTLLVGPPGCGKTLLARAVATEAGVPFFHASASSFVEKYVGIGAARVRKFFQNAQNYPASILFLDELEAVGSRDDQLGSGEYCQTISQLLVELDGMHLKRTSSTNKNGTEQQLPAQNPNADGQMIGDATKDSSGSSETTTTSVAVDKNAHFFVFLAATNRYHTLDPALLRPGRLDRVVRIKYPSQTTRAECVRIHAQGKLMDPKLPANYTDVFARQCRGRSCAEIAHVLNEAALLAARRRSSCVAWTDLLAALQQCVRRNRDFEQVGVSSDEEDDVPFEDTAEEVPDSRSGQRATPLSTFLSTPPVEGDGGLNGGPAEGPPSGRGAGPRRGGSLGGSGNRGGNNPDAMRLLGQLLIDSANAGERVINPTILNSKQ
ncbi:unnamed protein product [Amoebophrya sp. A120]|nr:unnamed protein product [Amoebophrya sp. A120]|eukprot:GSA120T00011783001.1